MVEQRSYIQPNPATEAQLIKARATFANGFLRQSVQEFEAVFEEGWVLNPIERVSAVLGIAGAQLKMADISAEFRKPQLLQNIYETFGRLNPNDADVIPRSLHTLATVRIAETRMLDAELQSDPEDKKRLLFDALDFLDTAKIPKRKNSTGSSIASKHAITFIKVTDCLLPLDIDDLTKKELLEARLRFFRQLSFNPTVKHGADYAFMTGETALILSRDLEGEEKLKMLNIADAANSRFAEMRKGEGLYVPSSVQLKMGAVESELENLDQKNTASE